jgi:hypothetical protein
MMTATIKRTEESNDWAEVTKALDTVRKDVRRELKKLGAQATDDRDEFEKALRGVVDVLEQGFRAATKSVHDPKLRKDLIAVAKAIRTALRKTALRTRPTAKRTTATPKVRPLKADAHGARSAKRTARKP